MTVLADPADAITTTTSRSHVHAVDVVRVLTFAAVIAVHTISYTDGWRNVTSNGAVMLLHFTREAFFVLTGFVLVHQYLHRPYRVSRFYRRRLLTVGVPYVVWSVLYTGLHWYADDWRTSPGDELRQLGVYLVSGTAWFHLYFLLVSMQVYLLYPLIAALLRVTRGHHIRLLLISGGIQVALMTYLYTTTAHGGGVQAFFVHHADVLVITYQFFVLLGAVAAAHLTEITAWIRGHRGVVIGMFLVTGTIAEFWYLHSTTNRAASTAAAVLQPVMVPWEISVVALLFLLGVEWSARRRAGSLVDRFFTVGSDRSFGIYLCHPVILWVLLRTESSWLPGGTPALARTLTNYLLTVAGAVLLTELFRRSPLSLSLTGRSRFGKPRPATDRTTPNPRRDNHHATHSVAPTAAPGEAADSGPDDGHRQRSANSAVRRHDGELQHAD